MEINRHFLNILIYWWFHFFKHIRRTFKKDELPEPQSHSYLLTVYCILSVYHLFIWLHWVLAETRGIFCCGTRASLVESRVLSSCGCTALVLCNMWDLSSPTSSRTHVPCIGRQIHNHWTTMEVYFLSAFVLLCYLNYLFT